MTTAQFKHTTYFLPIHRDSAIAFLKDAKVPAAPVERAGLFAMLMALGNVAISRAALARAVIDADRELATMPADAVVAGLTSLRVACGEDNPGDLLDSLERRGIYLASEERLLGHALRSVDGHFSNEFQEHCRDTLIEFEISSTASDPATNDAVEDPIDLTDQKVAPGRIRVRGTTDQAKAALAVSSSPDEHFSMTAYAGSGKTHLLLTLAESGGRYTHLAPTNAHSDAFRYRARASGVRSITLHRLATDMAAAMVKQQETRWIRPPRVGETSMPLEKRLHVAGIPAIAGAAPERVLGHIESAIASWCFSQRPQVVADDFAGSMMYSPEDRAAYVGLAGRVWEMMFEPIAAKDARIFTIRQYHLVKWLDLKGAEIPPLGTLLIDEAHDLSIPWHSLLERYPGGWIAMGDPYQSFSGVMPVSAHGKSLLMSQSVRMGRYAMPLLHSVLDLHSRRLADEPIVGSKDHETRRRSYTALDNLPTEGLRVFGREWKMLEDALRMKEASVRFRFIGASEIELKKVVNDAINLYRFGDRPKSYQLRHFTSWDQFADWLVRSGHGRVVRLFERGFTETNLDALLKAQVDDERCVALGLLEHCKSMEFGTVAMSDCCFSLRSGANSVNDRDRLVKSVYVAMTRVRDELWIPEAWMEMLSDQVRS